MAPRVFLSSTIRDLGDLRSAIRYLLEQLGFEVLTSETSDFPHDLEGDAWKAALAPIDLADYFVLLIGRRAGWLTPDGISVTHAELRRARDLHRAARRPQVLVLARDEILRDYRSRTPNPTDTEDWGAITALLDEVHHQSTDTDTTWVHAFASFEEVALILRTALRITGPLRRRVHETNVIEELLSNGEAMLMQVRGAVSPMSRLLLQVPKTVIELASAHLSTLSLFRLTMPVPERLATTATEQAILSGEFLVYEPSSGSMTAGDVQRVLINLRARIARYRNLHTLLQTDIYLREYTLMTPNGGNHRPSQTFLHLMWAARDELENIELLSRAVARYLAGIDSELDQPPLNPPTPDEREAARIQAEEVGREAVRAWLLHS
jgi:hypothetical protein